MELISFAAVTAKAASDRARHPPGVKGRVELSPHPAGGWRFRPDSQSGRP